MNYDLRSINVDKLMGRARRYFLLPGVLTCDRAYVDSVRSKLERTTSEDEIKALQREYKFLSSRCKPQILFEK